MIHRNIRRFLAVLLTLCLIASLVVLPNSAATAADDAYDGSQLWLNYQTVSDAGLLSQYRAAATAIVVQNFDQNPTYRHQRDGQTWEPVRPENAQETVVQTTLEAARLELHRALQGLLDQDVPYADAVQANGAIVVGTPDSSSIIRDLKLDNQLATLGEEGYLIQSVTIDGHSATVVAANSDIGALYGTYALIRLMQTQKSVSDLNIADQPKVNHRRLNNWDTERLYAGTNATGEGGTNGEDGSIFNFSSGSGSLRLPLILDRYIIFARMCASIGINEITINNVNANYSYLSEDYILREAALADVLRPYGIRIGLSVRYVSPTNSGCNTAADQAAGGPAIVPSSDANANNPYANVFQDWWTQKTQQIRSRIPDFIGYTVKANSEGQPGPQDYGYDHGDGAYGMGQALANVNDGLDNNMTLFWRTFVYNASVDTDRLKRAYMEFKPINDDSSRSFGDNVFVQTKNGPLDFQGREPIHPMFGAMDVTNQAIELQITQEYTGHHVSLCYLAPMWEEVFKTDTYANGEGTLVGEVIDGTAQGQLDTAIVGVNNIGNSANMTGHHFAQANFFAFGRLAWDWTQNSEDIADDWIRMTWSNDQQVVDTIAQMMMGSWEALVSYQTPFGVGHQMTGTGTHYFPNPSQIIYNGGTIRDDWSPAYYSRVDGVGIGYNRSGNQELTSFGNQQGSNLAGQYAPTLEALYGDMESCPEDLLLWFHHVPWDFQMDSGRTFWDEFVYRTQMGVQFVSWMRQAWASLEGKLDAARYHAVSEKLWRQEIDSSEWRDFYCSYLQANNGLDKPVDDGPLSIAITLGNAKTYQGFDLSVDAFNKTTTGNLPRNDANYNRYIAAGGSIADASGAPFNNLFQPVDKAYTIQVPAGVDHTITDVTFLSDEGSNESYQVLSNTQDQAVVQVTRDGFFGPLLKTYTFNFVTDTKLSGLQVDGQELMDFDPDTATYCVAAGNTVPVVTATAEDASQTVSIQQAEQVPGTATVTVGSGDAQSVYTIRFTKPAAFTEDFNGSTLSQDWTWVRENAANWTLDGNAMVLTTASGDLSGSGNNASNVLLHSAGNGDWEAVAKLNFSEIPSRNNQQGGIVVYQDDDNYVKVALQYQTGSGWWGQSYLRVVGGVEKNGSFSEMFYDALETEENLAVSGNNIWLKLTKQGDTYTASFATAENVPFRNLGSTTASFSDPKVGLLAVHSSNGPSLKVAYDSFTLQDNFSKLSTGPLAVVSEPAAYAGSIGDTATFHVGVNRSDVTYQWMYSNNGGKSFTASSMAGSNTDTLSVQMKSFRVGQQYKCVITDSEGNIVETQAVAMTTAVSGLAITSEPVDYTGPVDSTATFTVEATGEGLSYQWMYSNNGGLTFVKSSVSGANTPTVSVGVKAFRDGQMYRCVVTDASGNVVTSSAASMHVG